VGGVGGHPPNFFYFTFIIEYFGGGLHIYMCVYMCVYSMHTHCEYWMHTRSLLLQSQVYFASILGLFCFYTGFVYSKLAEEADKVYMCVYICILKICYATYAFCMQACSCTRSPRRRTRRRRPRPRQRRPRLLKVVACMCMCVRVRVRVYFFFLASTVCTC